MTRQNKFSGLKEALRERRVESPATPEQKESSPGAEERASLARRDPPAQQSSPGAEERAEERTPRKSKRGRPKGGKRSDPSFQQITLYMPSSLYLGVQKKLKQMRRSDGYEGPRDMSELVSFLVEGWNREV